MRINDEVKGDIEVLSETPEIYEIMTFVPAGENRGLEHRSTADPLQPAKNGRRDSPKTCPQSVAIDWIQIEGPMDPLKKAKHLLFFPTGRAHLLARRLPPNLS